MFRCQKSKLQEKRADGPAVRFLALVGIAIWPQSHLGSGSLNDSYGSHESYDNHDSSDSHDGHGSSVSHVVFKISALSP